MTIVVESLTKIYKLSNRKSAFKIGYEQKVALNNINFQIEQGDSVAYIGPNGSGKSTTIKLLTGLLTPTSGKVMVNGLDAQHCNLKLLIKAAPEETRNFDEFKPIVQHEYLSSHFQNKLSRVCFAAFQRVKEGMLNSSLEDHKHCISQLMELKKADKFAEFPVICPYAYAYVFWKTSLLKEENFYCDNLCRTNNTSYRAPLIINDHLEYFVDQIVNHQMSKTGGINPNILFWVLEKIVTQFCINFFKAWLRIAGNRSQETSVPSWKEIEKNARLDCPYQDELSKEAIQSMISFTPQKISMFVMSNPDQENLQLQKSVDLYVKKLNF